MSELLLWVSVVAIGLATLPVFASVGVQLSVRLRLMCLTYEVISIVFLLNSDQVGLVYRELTHVILFALGGLLLYSLAGEIRRNLSMRDSNEEAK